MYLAWRRAETHHHHLLDADRRIALPRGPPVRDDWTDARMDDRMIRQRTAAQSPDRRRPEDDGREGGGGAGRRKARTPNNNPIGPLASGILAAPESDDDGSGSDDDEYVDEEEEEEDGRGGRSRDESKSDAYPRGRHVHQPVAVVSNAQLINKQ